MSTTQHTQGPWTLRSKGTHQHGKDREIVGPKGQLLTFCPSFEGASGIEEARANAALMAAAPELLEALIDCRDRLRGVTGVVDPLKSADAAIAKATGG